MVEKMCKDMQERDRVIGQRIRAIRKMFSISQVALAAKLGVSPQQLQKYETGANKISASRIEIIADTLNVPVMAFFKDAHTITPTDVGIQLDAGSVQLMSAYHEINNQALKKLLVTSARTFVEVGADS